MEEILKSWSLDLLTGIEPFLTKFLHVFMVILRQRRICWGILWGSRWDWGALDVFGNVFCTYVWWGLWWNRYWRSDKKWTRVRGASCLTRGSLIGSCNAPLRLHTGIGGQNYGPLWEFVPLIIEALAYWSHLLGWKNNVVLRDIQVRNGRKRSWVDTNRGVPRGGDWCGRK